MIEHVPFAHALHLVCSIGVAHHTSMGKSTIEHPEARLSEVRAKLTPEQNVLVDEASEKMQKAVSG